jgi:hypothetical protein
MGDIHGVKDAIKSSSVDRQLPNCFGKLPGTPLFPGMAVSPRVQVKYVVSTGIRSECIVQVSDVCVRFCGPLFHDRLAVSTFFSKVQRAIMQPNAMGVCCCSLPFVSDVVSPFFCIASRLHYQCLSSGLHQLCLCP